MFSGPSMNQDVVSQMIPTEAAIALGRSDSNPREMEVILQERNKRMNGTNGP